MTSYSSNLVLFFSLSSLAIKFIDFLRIFIRIYIASSFYIFENLYIFHFYLQKDPFAFVFDSSIVRCNFYSLIKDHSVNYYQINKFINSFLFIFHLFMCCVLKALGLLYVFSIRQWALY